MPLTATLAWLWRRIAGAAGRPVGQAPISPGTTGGPNKPLNGDPVTGWALIQRALGFKRDEYFKLSVLMRLMSRRQLEIGSVAGLTVAFPRWWRIMREVLMVFMWTTSVYSEAFAVELTKSALSGVFLNKTNLVLAAVTVFSWMALTESAIYPIRGEHGRALDVVPYASGVALISAYIWAGLRSTGLHIFYPGFVGVCALAVNFLASAVVASDHRALADELGREFDHASMGLWLVINNVYPPDASDLEAGGWETVLGWILLAGQELPQAPKWCPDPNRIVLPFCFANSVHVVDRPTFVSDDRMTCFVSCSDVKAISGAKAPLVLTSAENLKLHTFGETSGLEGGQAHSYTQEVLNKQPKRQSELLFCIDDVGYVVDLPICYHVRRNTVFSLLGLLASGVMLCMPSVGAKIVSAIFAFILTHFADTPATTRWVLLQFRLASLRAGTIPDGDKGLCRMETVLKIAPLLIGFAVPVAYKKYESIEVGVLLAQVSVLFVAFVGHAQDKRCFCLTLRNGLYIKRDSYRHGYDLLMKSDGGESSVVGKNRLMFSRSTTGTESCDLHLDPEPGSRLVAL